MLTVIGVDNHCSCKPLIVAVIVVVTVVIVFKSGGISESGNYRLIAVVSPAFSTVLKRFVYDQLVSYLEKDCLRFNFQFSFRKGYFTEYTILETLENLKSAIDH